MKIMVISLTTSRARRKNIERQFADAGVEFEFFDAISTRDVSNHVHHYEDKEFYLNNGRSAVAGEIACYASHLAVWRECAAGCEPFLILEDDARLERTFEAALSVLNRQIRKLGLIRAAYPISKRSVSLSKDGNFDLRFCRRVPLLATGYAVSPLVAERLAAEGAVIKEPVDKYLQRFWQFRHPVFSIEPPAIAVDAVGEHSDIGDRIRPAYGIKTWLLRAGRKSENTLRRILWGTGFLLTRMPTVRSRLVRSDYRPNALHISFSARD